MERNYISAAFFGALGALVGFFIPIDYGLFYGLILGLFFGYFVARDS
ncbi:MAG: hypothetical protein WCW13_07095 [archaeon]|jgi:hypothetical protein